MKFPIVLLILATFAIPISAPAPALAKDADKPDKTEKKDSKGDARQAELKQRFQQRYAQIKELKKAGTVGETYSGYLEFVKGKKGDNASLVEEENTDRRELYKLIADKEGTTQEKVAERNAKRLFEKATAGEYLKDSDGQWHKKT